MAMGRHELALPGTRSHVTVAFRLDRPRNSVTRPCPSECPTTERSGPSHLGLRRNGAHDEIVKVSADLESA